MFTFAKGFQLSSPHNDLSQIGSQPKWGRHVFLLVPHCQNQFCLTSSAAFNSSTKVWTWNLSQIGSQPIGEEHIFLLVPLSKPISCSKLYLLQFIYQGMNVKSERSSLYFLKSLEINLPHTQGLKHVDRFSHWGVFTRFNSRPIIMEPSCAMWWP